MAKLIRKSKDLVERKYYAIFCEDEKTSCKYFTKFKDALKLSNTDIEVYSSCGKSAPINVVQKAKKTLKKLSIPKEYEKVFIVVDTDAHSTYEDAKKECKKNKNFEFIGSNPCFEYFLLLYYKYTSSNFTGCQEIKDKLKKLNHNIENEFYYIKNNYDTAFINAEKARKDKESNSFTDIDLVLKDLIQFS